MVRTVTIAGIAVLCLATGTVSQEEISETGIKDLIELVAVGEDYEASKQSLVALGERAVGPLMQAVERHARSGDWSGAIRLYTTVQGLTLKGTRSKPFLMKRLLTIFEQHGYDFQQDYLLASDGQVIPFAGSGGVFVLRSGRGVRFESFKPAGRSEVVRQLASAISKTKDRATAREAAIALSEMGTSAGAAVRILVGASTADTSFHALEAITALGMLGPVAVEAIPTLEKLTRVDDPQIALRALAALRQIRGK